PTEGYAGSLARLKGWTPLILGTERDQESVELIQYLKQGGIPHLSGSGWDLAEVAQALSRCNAYLGHDTGLAHLAEAIGIPAWVIFGPSAPELGFGPWRQESRAIEATELRCHPCSKDGRRCQRVWEPYACMQRLTVERVMREIPAFQER